MSEVCEIEEQGKELLQSFKDEFPSLTIEYKNGAICVRMLGFWSGIASKSTGDWVVNEEVKSILRNFVVFKQLESRLISENPSCRGAYLLVNNPSKRFVYATHDAAWLDKNHDGFIGQIGIEDSSEEVLALGAVEKPPHFDDHTARYNRCKRSNSNYNSSILLFPGTLFIYLFLTTESSAIVPDDGFVFLCSWEVV